MTGFLNGLVFLLVNGLVVFSSWCLAGHLFRESRSLSLRVSATSILYFVHLTVVVLLLGVVFRSLNAISVPMLSVLLSALVLFLWGKRRKPFLAPAGQALSEVFSHRDLFLYGVVCLFVAQVAVLLFKVTWLPPHVWDVFVYHLPPAVEWYQQGYIPPVLDSTVNRINGAPLGMTVLAYWFFIFLRNDSLVELPMLLWAITLVPVSMAVLRQSGVSRSWSLKFAVLGFFIPIVIMQSVTVKDHLGLNVGFLAGLLFLAEFLKHGRQQSLVVAAAAFGLMLGYKIAAPVHLLVALLLFSVLFWFRQRASLVDAKQRTALFKTVGLSAVIVAATGSYWYIRNLLFFGSLKGAYGATLTETGKRVVTEAGAVDTAWSIFAHSGNIRVNMSELLPRILDYQNSYGADLVGIAGFGPQFAALGIPALVIALFAFFNKRLRRQPVFLMSSAAVLLFVVLMFINLNVNSYRILSFFPMVLIAYAGVQLYHSGMLGQRWARGLTNGIIVVSIVWTFLTLLAPHYTNLLRLKEFVSLGQASRTSANYTRWFVRPRPSYYRIMDAIPAGEPIAFVAYRGSYSTGEATADTWQYLYMDRRWQRRTHSLHLPEYFDCQANGRCEARPALSTFLRENRVSLLSSCKVNRCLDIRDEALVEIVPGLYFFLGDK